MILVPLEAESLVRSLPKTLNVYSLPGASVLKTLSGIKLESAVGTTPESRNRFQSCKDRLIEWARPCIDLSEFANCYPSYGISGALDVWVKNLTTPVQMFRHDYRGLIDRGARTVLVDHWRELDPKLPLYITNPSTEDGCFRADWPEILEFGGEINLDLAYIGTFASQRIPVNVNVRRVFISLSKGFAIGSLRVGFVYAREPEPGHLSWNFHHFAYHCAEALLSTHPVDELSRAVRSHQVGICEALGLKPSDSVLLAYGSPSPLLDPWRRGRLCRVCLTPAYQSLGIEQAT